MRVTDLIVTQGIHGFQAGKTAYSARHAASATMNTSGSKSSTCRQPAAGRPYDFSAFRRRVLFSVQDQLDARKPLNINDLINNR